MITATPSDALAAAATVEAWALRFVTTTALADKLDPSPPPTVFHSDWRPQRIDAPGRPAELAVVAKTRRSIARGQLRQPRWRAHLLHTFLHHELQAAELMCWAILAFPDAPLAWRQGLRQICRDEIRHLQLYRAQVERLGWHVGDFPVRDWFWQRVVDCRSPVQFQALMGLGFEAGNLDHAARFAAWFAAAGDAEAARVQALVGEEEVAHVRFAAHWFARCTGSLDFARWAAELPPPLSPRLLRGRPLNRAARARAGCSDAFLDALAAT